MRDAPTLTHADLCDNCGTPISGGWIVHAGGPKKGAVLTDDGNCAACGAPFWADVEDVDEADK